MPQASSVVEVDLSSIAKRIEDSREAWQQRGLEPSFTPFFGAALLAAIRRVPRANAAFDADGRGIRRHLAVHLGLSLSSQDGGSACHGVVRDADTLNVLGLALEIRNLRALSETQAGAETLLQST
ncbi:MAG: 2-oxo acid dehydrogenase subunit E2, partial [Chloroflexota bacterium]|nr:2-oxo acid dehydrogenase subunit E2 [Chloroflexota bacterium]